MTAFTQVCRKMRLKGSFRIKILVFCVKAVHTNYATVLSEFWRRMYDLGPF